MTVTSVPEPRISRSLRLNFMGDWGQANFHRICGWLCQELCDRSGPKTRVAIWNTFGGGIDMPHAVFDGEMDLCLATPAGLMSGSLAASIEFMSRAHASSSPAGTPMKLPMTRETKG